MLLSSFNLTQEYEECRPRTIYTGIYRCRYNLRNVVRSFQNSVYWYSNRRRIVKIHPNNRIERLKTGPRCVKTTHAKKSVMRNVRRKMWFCSPRLVVRLVSFQNRSQKAVNYCEQKIHKIL